VEFYILNIGDYVGLNYVVC